MTIWNNTDIPLAYLITVRTYGTWLHGDGRGSVDRFMNKYGLPKIPQRDARLAYNKSLMKADPVILGAQQRTAVEMAVREVCDHRKWRLWAINVRTNHFHVVVTNGDPKPARALNSFKAYGTRKMREVGCWKSERSPWVDKGSERWLWNEQSISNAIDYVILGQGADLVDFDNWGK